MLNDLRFALRQLRKHPGIAIVTVLTLALGIGANTAIFSIVYAALLRPLPYQGAGRLVVMRETTPKVGTVSVSYPNYRDWRTQSKRFSGMTFVHSADFDLEGGSRPEAISAEVVSPSFLGVLGVRPLLGRDFNASEGSPASHPVAILSYSLWQSHFGGDPGAVGRTITLDGRPLTVVGVTPAGFRSLGNTEVLLPTGPWRAQHPAADDRGDRNDSIVIGRLSPGVGMLGARAEMQGIAARLARAYPDSNDQFGVTLEPLRDFFVGGARRLVLVLFGAVMFVLLIASGNVAILLLSTHATRAREIALRVALGASRLRLARQMLVESSVLALSGALLGLAVGAGSLRVVAAFVPREVLGRVAVGVNGPVLLFTLGVTLVVALLFGVVPVRRHAEAWMSSNLRDGGRAGSSRQHMRSRSMLAGSEIALTLALLVAAGLMVRSMVNLSSVDPGFTSDHVLTAELALRARRYAKRKEDLRFWQQLVYRVAAIPGVKQAALGTVVPFTDEHDRADITLEGMRVPSPGSFPHPDVHIVSSGYLSALGITLLRGRDFKATDGAGSPEVGIVNEELARRYFPGRDPLGRRFMFGHPTTRKAPRWITIVGEATNSKLYGLASPARLEVYLPYLQHPPDGMTLLVKSPVSSASLAQGVRSAVASIDSQQPVGAIATMDQLRDASTGDRRTALLFLGAFGGLAILLVVVGVYGVISYSVAQRQREVGIRMALGARPGDVLRMVLWQSGRIVIAGLAAGGAAAMALTHSMSGLLYAVRPGDPLTMLAAALLVGLIALVASYIPAARAVRVDPLIVLKEE